MRRKLVDVALRNHARLRAVLPSGHRPYPAPGGWIYLDVRESPMMLARVLRAYETDKVEALRNVLRPGAVFLDVGGNKGDFALLAARCMHDTGTVLCFEPEPSNVAWIERSVARNAYASIEVVPVALAGRAGTAVLHLGEKSGWHSLMTTEGVAVTGEVTVPTERLDDVLAARGIGRVDVVKIDVEGAENQVLDGAAATFGGEHPMTVLLDLHPRRGVDPVATCERLQAWGFTMDRNVTPRTRSVVASR